MVVRPGASLATPGLRPRFGADSNAVGQVIAFLAAGIIFVAALGAILLASTGSGRNDHGVREADQQTQAQRLADLMAGSPGVGWAAGNDHLSRLGLRATNGSGLQESSLDALRGALFTTSADGKVDYADARASLGLTGTQDFHLRMYPVGMSSIYKAADSHQRTGYLGDWQSLAAITIPAGTPLQEQSAAQAALNATMVSSTGAERQALRELGVNFADRVYISASSPTILVSQQLPLPALPILTALNMPRIEGGVYPDIKQYLDDNLPSRLANYDLFIIGSGVDQSAMTSAGVKYAIRDWVLAGGTLVVLGTANMNYQWLQPLFSTGVKTANGAASAPDPSHPMLQEPHALDWTRYNDHSVGWDLSGQTGFSHVVVQGGQDILAVSTDGSFGNGRVILTTFQPREVASGINQLEADHFLENVILYTDHAKLYLEYGPTQPDQSAVAVAVRQSYVYDDTLGQIPVRVEIHYWGSG